MKKFFLLFTIFISCYLIFTGLKANGSSDIRSGALQEYFNPLSPGPSINYVPLVNTENLNGPYVINATITPAGSGLVTGRTKVYWGRNTINDSITMTNSSGNNWTASIPGNGLQAQYRYYIYTIDSLGRSSTAPLNAPPFYYFFFAFLDTTNPIITYIPLSNQPMSSWPSTVTCAATDNIGMDSVWVRWYKNSGVNTKEFRLLNTNGNIYAADFNSLNSDVVVGDSIFYKIFAQDNSTFHNRDSTQLNKFSILPTFLCEGFSSAIFPPENWSLDFSGDLFWSRANESSYGNGNGSAVFDFYDAGTGTTQSMITLTFSNSVAGDSLKFDNAYQTYVDEVDRLEILTSTNGGSNYTSLIILDGGVSGPLVTAPPSQDPFSPAANQWATKKFSLPVGTNKINFKAISAYGNNLFLDSICVINGTVGISNLVSGLVPENFSLLQNYPNPFNPVTKINYELPKSNFVSLKIFNVLGKEVATLVNEKQNAGKYSVNFNAAGFPSGVYFYKIQSGEFEDVKRMVLIK